MRLLDVAHHNSSDADRIEGRVLSLGAIHAARAHRSDAGEAMARVINGRMHVYTDLDGRFVVERIEVEYEIRCVDEANRTLWITDCAGPARAR
jgi:hypothetical protein